MKRDEVSYFLKRCGFGFGEDSRRGDVEVVVFAGADEGDFCFGNGGDKTLGDTEASVGATDHDDVGSGRHG